MSGEPLISRIYSLGPTPKSENDAMADWCRVERLRRDAWRKCGMIAVDPVELPEPLATDMRKWAEDQYGAR